MTIDGVTYALEPPFLVVATQNPIEYEGTYPLPEAQLDRFTRGSSLGYPPLAEEARMLAEQTTAPPLDDLEAGRRRGGGPRRDRRLPAGSSSRRVSAVTSSPLLRHTRDEPAARARRQPAPGIALLRMAKARAVARGRDYVLPEDVQAVAVPCSLTG